MLNNRYSLVLLLVCLSFLGLRTGHSQTCVADPGFSPAVTISTPTFTSSLPVVSWTGTSVHLEADLTVDGDFLGGPTFSVIGSTIRIDPGVKIIVQSDFNLRVINSVLTDCDNIMWETLEIQPRGTATIESSVIEHADVGVTSLASTGPDISRFTILGSQLLNNRIGVLVESHDAFHIGRMEATAISAPSLIAPLAGAVGIGGMRIEDVPQGINIGSTGNAYGDGSGTFNTFNQLEIGIYLINAQAYIQNNFFDNIFPSTNPNFGVAVAAERTSGPKLPVQFGAPGSPFGVANNRIQDCRIGVLGLSVGTVNAEQNEFVGLSRAVWLQLCEGPALLDHNEVTDIEDFGFYIRNHMLSPEITRNTIINTSAPSNPAGNTNGIQLRNITTNGPIVVSDNTITNMPIGITAIASGDCIIESNVIGFTKPTPTNNTNFGIAYINMGGGRIAENTITASYCSSCTAQTQTRGVIVEASTSPSGGPFFEFNDVTDAEAGFFLEGTCTNTKLRCNQINNCTNGFQLDGMTDGILDLARINGFAGGTSPADNQWVPSATSNRTFSSNGSDAAAIPWFYRNSSPEFIMDPVALFNIDDLTTGVTSLFPTIDNTGTPCSYFRSDGLSDLTAVQEREEKYGALKDFLIQDLSCNNLMHQRRYDAAEALGVFNLGHESDSAYNRLLADVRIGWVDEFREAENLWKGNNLVAAHSMLNSITATCHADRYKAYALNRYWSRFDDTVNLSSLSAHHPFTHQEYYLLDSIAKLPFSAGGYGTLEARALTDWLPANSPGLDQSRQPLQGAGLNKAGPNVYPNPANSFITISLDDLELSDWSIVDVNGALQAAQGEILGKSLQIEVGHFGPGFYVVNMLLKNGEQQRATFIKSF